MILDNHVAITFGPGRESYEVTNYAIVRYIAINVGMKVPPNFEIGGEHGERTQYGTLSQHNVVEHHHVGRNHGPWLYPIRSAAFCQLLSHCTISNGKYHMPCTGFDLHKFRVSQYTMAIYDLRFGLIVNEY